MKLFCPADILLPRCPLASWATIACDQHTSDPAYWQAAEKLVGDSPSALRITLPEVYLSSDNAARIEEINRTMEDYLAEGLFDEYRDAYVFVERTLADGRCRRGIVGAIDLEAYDYRPGRKPPVRSTESTVAERIPPRVEIRRNAPLELPHVMLLIDDWEKSIIEPLAEKKENFRLLYDFELMLGGGHVKGYLVDQDSSQTLEKALDRLADAAGEDFPLLFAVGDGNHSLAAAKACYEENPRKVSRYALAEVVNLHDPALDFEPIYRLLFGVEPTAVLDELTAYFAGKKAENVHKITALYGENRREITLPATAALAVTLLQEFLDDYLRHHPEAKLDYIHGVKETIALSRTEGSLGFLFEGMKKEELFPAVRQDGALVRKTFSMGEACDKRYYVEARKIQ